MFSSLPYVSESHAKYDIKADLVDKISYDDPSVFRRLRVHQVDRNLVEMCAESFNAKNAGDIGLIIELEELASQQTPEQLEVEEINDRYDRHTNLHNDGRSGNHGSEEEREMYDPLMRIFSFIANFGQNTIPRKFQRTDSMFKPDEPHPTTFNVVRCSPDITISQPGINASMSRSYGHRDAFGEIKPSKKQGVKPANGGKILPIVIQSADYARFFMSARPFMLFCVGILICGTDFCVGIFDRNGITFSPSYSMFQDPRTFIRVVRSLACDLSIEELGSDPTVRVLTDLEIQDFNGIKGYPHAVVSSVGNDPRQWCTIGPPMWTSTSLSGRCTNVWLVREYVVSDTQEPLLKGDEMIMKTAWRSSARTSESDIYKSIDRYPVGLAKFECGGDVKQDGYPITVQNLRSHPVKTDLPEGDTTPPTPVLHRLILGTVGSPLWEYKSDVELLSGFRDALQAHKGLCEQGILHRDISVENVLLTKDPNTSFRGFITDLDLASKQIIVDSMNATTRSHTTSDATATVKRGAVVAGTVQFMSQELLVDKNIKHEANHDIESFIWVLSFCVMRRLYDRASEQGVAKEVHEQLPAFQELFSTAFGQRTRKDIANYRQSGSPCLVFVTARAVAEITARFMSKALIALFQQLRRLIYITTNPVDPPPLTHDDLLAVVIQTLDVLSSTSSSLGSVRSDNI